MSAVRDKIVQYWNDHPSDLAEKKSLFIQGLRESGTVLHAAEFAGTHRNCAYDWRKLDPEFRAAWDEALEGVTDNVERSLYNQAVSEKNVVATIFYLKANRAKYRDRVQLDIPTMQRQVEQRLEEYRQQLEQQNGPQLSLSSASTKDIINSVLGFEPCEKVPRETSD